MSVAERNMIHELVEQLELNSFLLREGLMLAIDHKKELVPVFRYAYTTNEKKLDRASQLLENDGKKK
ncbi:MAG: hypothetical protein FWH27_19320 [Planctomycetaceae bacterium]|nr:hypothetical protein [Planctomycetaceae bacterium]